MNSPDSSRDISIKQEEPEDHSHLDILHMVVCEEVVSSKQERSHCLLQEELKPPHIKEEEEEEELLKRQEEPAGSMLTLLPVEIEDGDEDICSRSFEVEVELETESESESEVESDTELTEDSDDWDETNGDILHMVVCKDEVSPKPERRHRLLQEELEPPHIKDEEEELLKRPEEPAGSMLTLLAEVKVEVESDTEVTEDSDDWDETSGGQPASNTSSIARKRQGDAGEQRSYSHLNCAQSIQKNILLINTPWQMQDASAKKPRPIMPRPINVIYANALGSSNVPVINIPLVLAYNGHHYGSLIRSSECQHDINSLQKHTSDTAFTQQTDTVLKSKICKKCKKTFKNLQLHLRRSSECQNYGIDSLERKSYAEKLTTYEQQQLHTQAKAQHTIDVPIVSKHHPTEVCKQCHGRFLHLNMHLSKSPPCQSYYDVHSLQKKADKHATYRQRQRQLQTRAQAHCTIDTTVVSQHQPNLEVCKQCHTHFRLLNIHLSKSLPCRTYYDIHSLQKEVDRHATYRQRQRQLKAQAKAHHTIDIPIDVKMI